MCGIPFESAIELNGLCPTCLKKSKPWQKARAIVMYNETSKKLILPFKHADQVLLTPLIARLMLQQKDFIKTHDLIIPVPLHWKRLIKRRYNQSTLLAREISRKTHIPYDPCLLKRRRATVPQGHLSQKERHRNVQNAFCVRNTKKLIGKRILLIDDVMTSGATVENCTKTLLACGVASVDILTFAKVVKNTSSAPYVDF